jgi:hypothetical protein
MNPGIRLTLRIMESVGLGFGPALVALNFFNFKPASHGYYYTNGSEWGIASGVFLICLAIIARRWNR